MDGEWNWNVKKPEKMLKPRCSCKEIRNGAIQCHRISEADRKTSFDKFWNYTWDQKRVYVQSTVKVFHTNRQRDRKDPKKSKRVHSCMYFLKKGDGMVRVCKTLYLNTLSIGKSCIWGWKVGALEKSSTENPVAGTKLKKPFDQELYIDYAKSKNVKPLSIATFTNTLSIKKISIFKPKKDLCEICNGHKLGHIYYKTKLCVHNWCIYNLNTHDGYCFIWNETEGGLNSDEFATILTKFFTDMVIPKMDDNNRCITLYTDGCTYQNRNIVLSNSLLNVAMMHNVTIEQKYLEVGHTQMEVDSMHAMIEKKLKNKVINVPAEYITICKNAKKVKPYQVEYLNYSFFKNFKEMNFYNSIRPGKMK